MFKLRPHHGICIGFFQGKGYSDEFTEHMTDTIKYLEENNPQICVTSSTDEICRACPNNIKGQCNGYEKVSAIDKRCLDAVNIKDKTIINYKDYKALIKEKILDKAIGINICKDCQWTDLCYKQHYS